MAKFSTKGLVLVALILSLVTTLLIYKYLSGISEKANKPGMPVVVAKVDIPPRTVVTADMVQLVNIPPEYIQPGAMNELAKVVGVTTREQIVASEQITARRLGIEAKPVGFSGLIPHDKRAITITVNEVIGVGGFIKPGDYVDIVATYDKGDTGAHTSKLLLQNVLVLAVDHDTESGVFDNKSKEKDSRDQSNKTSTITIAVNANEASQIALAEEKGKYKLALRPFMPTQGIVVAAATTPQEQVGYNPGQGNNQSGEGGGSSGASPGGSSGSGGGYSSSSSSPAKAQPGFGVQTIRGTKVETVPVN